MFTAHFLLLSRNTDKHTPAQLDRKYVCHRSAMLVSPARYSGKEKKRKGDAARFKWNEIRG